MKKIYTEKKQKIIEEAIKLVIIIALYLTTNGVFTEKDITRRIIDTLGIMIPILVYIVILLFSNFITKPIIMELNIKNLKGKEKESMEIYHHNTEREDQRTIVLSIQFIDKATSWSRLAKRIYKNSKIKINLTLQPQDDSMLIQPTSIYPKVEEYLDNKGVTVVSIDVTDVILSKLDYNIPIRKEYKFIISENPDNLPQNDENYFIKPKVSINDKEFNFRDNKLIEVKSMLRKGYYEINYMK
ncbi:hypothetical protein KPL42_13140 [Clostridium gasigenes]|uniref:hypothetical protein n=1 Tax=Clostridium gasigenes TaxID=94869 RepID=UPI001C0A97C7|nr:hypothetical protein [Clostridium gasigenes]MBU3089436.1 hypothetical protein [Clostridium gasigenes]